MQTRLRSPHETVHGRESTLIFTFLTNIFLRHKNNLSFSCGAGVGRCNEMGEGEEEGTVQALAVLTRWSGPEDNDPTNGGETEATSWVGTAAEKQLV